MNPAVNVPKSVLAAHGVNAEVIIAETGASRADQTEQADLAIKAFVHAASTGASRVYLHGLWDLPRWSAGVLENTPPGQMPVRKPSFVACQTLIRMIGKNHGVRYLGPGRYRVMLPEDKSVYIVWSEKHDEGKPDFLLGRIRVTTLKNEVQEIDVDEWKWSSHPVIVEPLQKSTDR